MLDKYSIQFKTYSLFWKCVDWIFPPECVGCGREGTLLCSDCRHTLVYASQNTCIYCGAELAERGICSRCAQIPHAITELRYIAGYQGVLREAIHRLKYEGDLGIALELAEMMALIVAAIDWKPDLVMPVPLSEKRKSQRGYNQAAMLAFPLSLKLGLPLNSRDLVRIHETRSQVFLSFNERQENVQGAFLADPKAVKDKTILLVDDVFTTGATINAAAEALVKAGSRQVYAITAAKALRRQTVSESPESIDV